MAGLSRCREGGAIVIISDAEIAALADRLVARADGPGHGSAGGWADMRLAARILRRILADGTVHGFIRLDDGGER